MPSSYPSVTKILSPWSKYNSISPEVLAQAQERGVRVHSACFALCLGVWSPVLPEEWRGYVKSFENWLNDYVAKVVLVEPEFVSKVHRFKGHPDLVVEMKGDSCLSMPDIKTPLIHNKSWQLQCAAYKSLGIEAGHEIKRIFALRLKKDGTPALVNEYTGSYPYDLGIFYNALACWRYFNG